MQQEKRVDKKLIIKNYFQNIKINKMKCSWNKIKINRNEKYKLLFYIC